MTSISSGLRTNNISKRHLQGAMERMVFIFQMFAIIKISLLLIISFTYEVQGKEFHFAQRMKTDTYENMNVYIFETLTGLGINDCIEACKAIKLCIFINHHRQAKLCFLIGVQNEDILQIENNLEMEPVFYFGDKSEWNVEEYIVCEGCNKFGVCKNEEDSNYSICLASGCEPPENKENAIFLGNMFSVGNRVRHKCIQGYRMNTTGPLTSTCFENGTWGSVDVKCLPEAVFGNDVYEFNSNFYKLIRKEQNWDAAYATCTSMGLHLVDIKYPEEQLFITENIVDNIDCYWTGGRRRNGQLVWLDETAVSAGGDWNWGQDQPNHHASQDCIALKDYNDYKWNDKSCSNQCYVICELK